MNKHSLHKPKKRASRKIGLPPGSLVYIGDHEESSSKNNQATVSVIEYNKDQFNEFTLSKLELSTFQRSPNQILWLNIHGVHDTELIQSIGQRFHIHPLVLEDILNTEQRPKVDEFDDYLFLETRNFYYHSASLSASSEQISLLLGRDFLLTFQERSTGIFEPIRERMRASHAHIRELGADYLAYAVLDNIIDRYFFVLEQIGEENELLETKLLKSPSNTELHQIHQLKRVCIELRRATWPLREVINHLSRNDQSFFQDSTIPYLRDIYDHTVNFIESLESIRDSLAGLMDIYMASVSNRVNLEVRALTVVAMLFMPATLIAGIFGMNFEQMPLLKEQDGFWWVIGLMIGIATLMGLIFWRRQWLSRKT